ncbi:DUF2461 domain-containing protein [Xylanibacter muris]|uniref:DUF2461 domain-containing protein n=1 Tax=Xylanibacter muris TaxID=2736290 RepID=A0ABX2AMU4_9BACT|nr:DUF2461 domain-containing protein [Xylanibacter muris]NPD91357.1 DUF2461 domain-containing protein [Xylanibacter muris]
MNTRLIFQFLRDISANNDREWFHANRAYYDEARADFEDGVAMAINRIAAFDPSVAHVTVKDSTYRFYRDTRFSADKSPYKNHFGAYIAAHGKKSLHGGYYIHLEAGHSLLSCGNYWLPTNILTSCRNEIMGNIDEWLRRVRNEEFLKFFGAPSSASWNDAQGFGLERLKTCPSGFPRDYQYIDYLRQKDYCCWHQVADDFFEGDGWLDTMERVFKAGKPMMDFVNAVIDDYE